MAKTTPATLALRKAGVAFTLHTYDYDPEASRVGLQAAQSLGADPARVLKTLMAQVDGKPVCAVLASDQEVAMKKLAAVFGGKTAAMMKPADAERLTGYRVGGVSPFGQKRLIPTVVDEASTAQTGLPSTWAIRVFSTRAGSAPRLSAACRPTRPASGS